MDVYDVITAHLVAQKAQSLDWSGENCKYRGSEGKKCALGCLIPDDRYDLKLEGKAIVPGELDSCSSMNHGVLGMIDPLYRDSPEFDAVVIRMFQRYHDDTTYLSGRTGCYSYAQWVDRGDEAHHPEKFLAAVREHIARQAVLAKGSD